MRTAGNTPLTRDSAGISERLVGGESAIWAAFDGGPMTTFTYISRGAARMLAIAALATCAVATSLSITDSASAQGRSSKASASGYGWPVKPFDRQHPIRGGFGDPR